MARDAAASAQADVDAHEASPHNTDTTARAAAATAKGAADTAQADLDAHEATPHNFDTIASATRRRIGTEQPSLTMSARHTTPTARPERRRRRHRPAPMIPTRWPLEKWTPAARRRRRGKSRSDWAESDNSEPIPAPKLVNVVNAHEDIVNVLDGRLPGLPVADASGLVAEGGIYRGGFRPAVAAYRRQYFRHERWPGRAAVPARPRVGPDVVLGNLAGRRSRRCGD